MSTAGEVFRRTFSQEVGISNGGSSDQELHVLAVDDSLVDRKVIERLLKISSCKVTAVDSGTRALQYLGLDGGEKSSVGFNDLKVNLIMTDYSMPGMTGYELLKKIKESSAFREIPVVIMSSENILTRIDRCLEEGAEEFLVKPVKLSDVRRLKDFIIAAGEHKRKGNILKRKVEEEEEEEEDSMFESSSESSDSSSSSSSSSSDLLYSTFVSSASAVNMPKRAKLQSRDSFC